MHYIKDFPTITTYSAPFQEDKVVTINITKNNTPIRAIVFLTYPIPRNNVDGEEYMFYNESDDENYHNEKVNVPDGDFWYSDKSVNFEKFLPLNCVENEYFKAEFNEDFSQLTYTIKSKINEVINKPLTAFKLIFFGDNSQYNADILNKKVEDLDYCTIGSIEFQTSEDFKMDIES
ncbi:MAG: hypothetical protein R3Y50_00590 [Rikenellaceae bacterium]